MVIPRVARPSAVIRRNAFHKGLLGGRRGWLLVGGIVWGRGALKKVFGKNEEVIGTEVLKRGQFVRIEAIRPPTRKQRRAARRAASTR